MPESNEPRHAGSDPLKVCFVSLQARGAFFPGPGVKIGGAERQVRLLADALASGGLEVHVIVEDCGQPEQEAAGIVTLWRLDQPAEAKSGLGRAWRKLASGLALQRMAGRLGADVYIQRCAGAETGLVEHAAHGAGGRFVYMLANDWELEPPWSEGSTLASRLFRRGLRHADLIVCQHEGQQAGVQRLFGREAELLPNAYPFGAAAPECGERILWVGRCVRQKRPERFIGLVRSLPEHRFLMVAQPVAQESDQFAWIEQEAATLSNVDLIPGAPPDRMASIYREAGMLVNTSDREGMPNVFLEAADAGLALVSLSVDPGGMFSKHGAGMVAGGAMDELVGQVGRLAGDPAARREQARQGRAWLAERHALERVGPRFRQLIEALVI